MYELSGVWKQWRSLGSPPTDPELARVPPPQRDWPDVDEAAIRAEMERRLVQRGWLVRRAA